MTPNTIMEINDYYKLINILLLIVNRKRMS